MLNEEQLQTAKYLSKANIKSLAPSVFSDKPSEDVSSKYTHIPTERVIDDMELLGWKPIEAKEVKARKLSTRGFQKHLLVFRNDDVVINGKDGDTVFPQILLTNSHDGKNAFTFQAGLYRLVCENGLVIADTQFEDVKMRHMGYTFEDLQVLIKEMGEKLPLTVESMNQMKAKEEFEARVKETKRKAIEDNIKQAQESGNVLTQTIDENDNLIGVKETVDFDSREAVTPQEAEKRNREFVDQKIKNNN